MSTFSVLLLCALSANDADTVLVQFSSAQCSSCRAMHPVVERLAAAGYPLQQIDVDQQPQYAAQFKVQSLPTFVLFSRGREAGRVEGPSNVGELSGLFHAAGYRPSAAPQPVAAQQPAATANVQYTSAPAPVAQPTAVPASLPGGPGVTAAAPAAAGVSPQQRAAWATVRLKVEDNRFSDFGTGTIIDRHDDEALVLTCGHLFRDSKGKCKITVDLFAPGATKPVEGTLIAYDADERDIALVSIRPGIAIEPVPVAPAGYAVQPRDRVFTIGCDKGAAPSLRNSFITPNRYVGAPRFTADGAPVEGRSGGGLFTESGLLIGVCNSANAKDNHGLYAALPTVHWQLDQIGQSAIYAAKTPANAMPASATAVNFEQPAAPPAQAPRQDQLLARNAPALLPNMPATMPRASMTAAAAAPAGQDDSEVIVIVRSKSNPTKQSEIFLLDRPPAEVIRILQTAYSQQQPDVRGTSQDLLRSAARFGQPGVEQAPVVRGQSQ